MTIKDLAAKTGYAVGTVSRVLNNQPNVSEKARRTILAAAAECGFQLNENARQLKRSHATSILLLVKGRSNELFDEMTGIIQSLVAGIYPLMVEYVDESENEVRRALQLCREKKPLAIAFLGGERENFRADFAQIDIPCVLVTNDATGLPFENLSSVSIDDTDAGRRAAKTLLSLGHRKFALVGGDREASDIARLRHNGCLDALREHGIEFDSRDCQTARFSYQGGYDAVTRLLEAGRQFTALIAVSDVMAIGAIRALRDGGLRVPEDVSVMSFDGLPLGAFLVPQLSSVGQPISMMAEKTVQILRDSIEQGQPARRERVPFTLLQRESVHSV